MIKLFLSICEGVNPARPRISDITQPQSRRCTHRVQLDALSYIIFCELVDLLLILVEKVRLPFLSAPSILKLLILIRVREKRSTYLDNLSSNERATWVATLQLISSKIETGSAKDSYYIHPQPSETDNYRFPNFQPSLRHIKNLLWYRKSGHSEHNLRGLHTNS